MKIEKLIRKKKRTMKIWQRSCNLGDKNSMEQLIECSKTTVGSRVKKTVWRNTLLILTT